MRMKFLMVLCMTFTLLGVSACNTQDDGVSNSFSTDEKIILQEQVHQILSEPSGTLLFIVK